MLWSQGETIFEKMLVASRTKGQRKTDFRIQFHERSTISLPFSTPWWCLLRFHALVDFTGREKLCLVSFVEKRTTSDVKYVQIRDKVIYYTATHFLSQKRREEEENLDWRYRHDGVSG